MICPRGFVSGVAREQGVLTRRDTQALTGAERGLGVGRGQLEPVEIDIGLREQLYRVFAAIAAKAPIPEADLAGFNATLSRVPARTHLAAGGSGAVWAVRNIDAAIPDLLTPVIWAAADLLAQKEHHRLRSCANDKCLWLFIDRSKAGTRRWCDMKACGNRAKSHRHYARSKLR